MFEKEAEEYYYKTYPVTLNIGEEERKKKITDLFIKCAEFGYNKANEWKYPSEGEFPTENTMLLLARKTVNGVRALIGYYKSNQFEIFNEKSCKMQNIDSVYAWKEIVLPMEIE